jgi:two-component system response regulator RpfG
LRLARAGEYRDENTGNHVERMAGYCHLMARQLGLGEAECEAIERAAPMHDIGKIGIPDRILRKPGQLTDAEFAVMRQHSRIGYEILCGSPSHYLQLGATIALGHHEKFDGSGYPQGLRGEEIPLAARIVAVADVFDALTSVRPYKQAWTLPAALEYLRKHSGGHFDPRCVSAFLAALPDIEQVRERLGDDHPGAERPPHQAGGQ